MNFESDVQVLNNDSNRPIEIPDQVGPLRRRRIRQNPVINVQNENAAENINPNQELRNYLDERNDGGIMPALNGILPLLIEGIDERDIYTRFTSSELARYTINLLKERIHLLRLIFTIFVLVFTNMTNLLILLPSNNKNEYSLWETSLLYIIYITPLIQFHWFMLLVLGRNNSKYYISVKFTIIGLTSVTSIIAYFGVLEDDIFQMCDSHIVFFICMANISATLLCCFFVLFSIGLI